MPILENGIGILSEYSIRVGCVVADGGTAQKKNALNLNGIKL